MLVYGFSERGSLPVFYAESDGIFVVLWFSEKQADSRFLSGYKNTQRYQRKKFQFYFYYLSVND